VLSEALYSELAEELGLSQTAVLQALEEGEYKVRVRADFSSGVRSGVNGTPTFFINGDNPPINPPTRYCYLRASLLSMPLAILLVPPIAIVTASGLVLPPQTKLDLTLKTAVRDVSQITELPQTTDWPLALEEMCVNPGLANQLRI
jgi:hypothetical protein